MIKIDKFSIPTLALAGYKRDYEIYVKVEFPTSVFHKGKEYFRTEKYGTGMKDHIPAAEYATAGDDERLWLNANDKITED